MNKVFADSFYFFAISNPKDYSHSKAKDFIAGFSGAIVTTDWILTEVADGFSRSSVFRKWFVDFFNDLSLDPLVQIIPYSRELFTAGLELYSRRLDKEWSLTDCVSFVVMERLGIFDALTGDRHFEQAGFVALLK